MIDVLVLVLSVAPVDWSPGPVALKQAAVPIVGILVIAVIIAFAVAFVRLVTGRSLDKQDDD